MSSDFARPGVGHCLFAGGLCAVGLLDLRFADFALNWQPAPADLPLRPLLACASGAALIACAAGTFVRPAARGAAAALAAVVLAWLALLEVPRVIRAPADVGVWLGFCETSMLVAGSWLLLARRSGAPSRLERAGRIVFGASLPPIGLSHFVYARSAVGLVPAWLPMRLGFVYLTGAGHIAAGAGLLLGVVPSAAATAEAAMLSCFVLLVHLPAVARAPTLRLPWTMLCVSTAFTGAAWLAAEACRRAEPARTETPGRASGR